MYETKKKNLRKSLSPFLNSSAVADFLKYTAYNTSITGHCVA